MSATAPTNAPEDVVSGNGIERATRSPGRPPSTSSADTRRRIVEAARKCFASEGYDVTTNWNVATAAGITPRALYHYFESKRSLFTVVYDETYREFFSHIVGEMQGRLQPPAENLAGWLAGLIDAVIGFASNDPAIGAFLAMAPIDMARSPELKELIYNEPQDAVYSIVTQMAQDLADSGRLHPDAKPLAVAHLIVGTLLGANLVVNVFGVGNAVDMGVTLKLLAAGSLFGGEPAS